MESSAGTVQFGTECRKLFVLDEQFTFLNHGSYGTVPKEVIKSHQGFLESRLINGANASDSSRAGTLQAGYKENLQAQMEKNPDHWFRTTSHKLWLKAREQAAQFLHAHPDNLVFVTNATTGVNTILKSFPLKSGEAILFTNLTYNAIKLTGSELLLMDISFPITSENQIVQMYEKFFKEHQNIKLAVIDYITSPTSVMMPVKKLIHLCHENDVLALIDGAHTPGHIPLNLEELGADFFTGNLHKWMYALRGCAVLWVNPKHHQWVEPLVTSHFFGQGLCDSFFMQGTCDQTNYFSVCDSLQFYEKIGGMPHIVSYTQQLAAEAANMLAKAWGTEKLAMPSDMEAPNMKLIKLPPVRGYEKTKSDANTMIMDLIYSHQLVTVIDFIQGELYTRICAQVYNTIDDYYKIRDIITAMKINA